MGEGAKRDCWTSDLRPLGIAAVGTLGAAQNLLRGHCRCSAITSHVYDASNFGFQQCL
jgi:hypothetical protein